MLAGPSQKFNFGSKLASMKESLLKSTSGFGPIKECSVAVLGDSLLHTLLECELDRVGWGNQESAFSTFISW